MCGPDLVGGSPPITFLPKSVALHLCPQWNIQVLLSGTCGNRVFLKTLAQ